MHRNNLGLNTFSFQIGYKNMSNNPHWEFILLSLKDGPQTPIGAMFSKNQKNLCPDLRRTGLHPM
ncbi:MAG: hypothetical protein R2814_18195 [Flavobacteriaceae bacterium]